MKEHFESVYKPELSWSEIHAVRNALKYVYEDLVFEDPQNLDELNLLLRTLSAIDNTQGPNGRTFGEHLDLMYCIGD